MNLEDVYERQWGAQRREHSLLEQFVSPQIERSAVSIIFWYFFIFT